MLKHCIIFWRCNCWTVSFCKGCTTASAREDSCCNYCCCHYLTNTAASLVKCPARTPAGCTASVVAPFVKQLLEAPLPPSPHPPPFPPSLPDALPPSHPSPSCYTYCSLFHRSGTATIYHADCTPAILGNICSSCSDAAANMLPRLRSPQLQHRPYRLNSSQIPAFSLMSPPVRALFRGIFRFNLPVKCTKYFPISTSPLTSPTPYPPPLHPSLYPAIG